jgi:hypothetical protein
VRQKPDHPLRREAREQDEREGEDRQNAEPDGAPDPQRSFNTTPALMMPGAPALSMVADST